MKTIAVDIKTINAWPIAQAGLPERVTHGLLKAGIATVGELRRLSEDEQRRFRGIGARSTNDIRDFFKACARLETGTEVFTDWSKLCTSLLTPIQRRILETRFALLETDIPRGRQPTLQHIADAHGLTRERVRQIEARALRSLSSAWAQARTAPILDYFKTEILARGDVLTAEALATLPTEPWLGRYHSFGALALLSACGGGITRHGMIFSTRPPDILLRIEQAMRLRLDGANRPMLIEDFESAAGEATLGGDPSMWTHARQAIMANAPGLFITRDGRYFTNAPSAAALVEETMQSDDAPWHFRALLRAVNTRLRPGRRMGSGLLLGALRDHPRFERTSSGHYRLRRHDPPKENGRTLQP